MGKGPGRIYKDCLAEAMHTVETLQESDIALKAGKSKDLLCSNRNDVLQAFMMEDYPMGKAARRIAEWQDIGLIVEFNYEGFPMIGYMKTKGSFSRGAYKLTTTLDEVSHNGQA